MIKAKEHIFKQYTDEKTYAKIVGYDCVSDMWEHSVKEYAENIALATAEEKITYAQLDSEVAAFRTVLKNGGVVAGDKVGVYMPNCIAFAKAYLAITTLGGVAVLLPAHLDEATVFGCSMKFGLKALVYDEKLEGRLGLLIARNPAVRTIAGSQTAEEGTPAVSLPKTAPCTVIFTGGTTGKSKGSLLSNGAVMQGTKNGCYGYKEVFEQRYLLVLPLTHVFGLIRNLLTSLYTGSALFICLENKDMFRDIAIFQPTALVLVPALAEMALNLSKKLNKNMLGGALKTIICGAAFVPPYLVEEYEKLGVALLPGYGLTESANLVSGNAEAKRKPGSVGYLYEGIEAKLVDGELWLKGPNMQDAYYGEEENASAYEDGWFKTGDLAHFDEEGLLYITGRKKEIIVLSTGENISPAELEAEFSTIDAVQDCLVYENEKGLLELEVFVREVVVKAKGIEDAEGYIRAEVERLNETFPAFSRVTKVVFRDTDFVRSPAMKIIRSKNGYVKN